MKRIITSMVAVFVMANLLAGIRREALAQSTSVTATIASGSPVTILGFNTNDTIDIVATLNTTDPNENGEGEPLILQSSTGFSGVVSAYAQATTFSFKATGPGTLSGFISGFDGDESATVSVTLNTTQKKRFTQAQKDAFAKASAELNTQAGAEAAIAAICALGLIPNPSSPLAAICTGSAGILSGVTWFLSGLLNQLALDPSDPNFTVIAQPNFPSLPPLTAPPGSTQAEIDAVNAFNALVTNQEHAIGFAQAAITSFNRAQGAFDAGNAFWEQQQVQAANGYIAQLASLIAVEPALLAALQNALTAAGFPNANITPSVVFNFEIGVLNNGLPAPIVQTLIGLGADSAAINQIRQIALVQDINAAAGIFPQLLTRPSVISALQALVASLGITVAIDIKPDSSTNPINPGSNGKIPVAILSTATFDATTQVDRTSLTFGRTGDEDSLAFTNAGGEDVNGDGLPDLVCHFKTPATGFQAGDTAGILKGRTVDGLAITGQDSIVIVP